MFSVESVDLLISDRRLTIHSEHWQEDYLTLYDQKRNISKNEISEKCKSS